MSEIFEKFDLTGKTTLITGGAGLLGVEHAANKNEYRSAIQFLCSDASAYLNGQNIVMDGGRSVL